MHGEYTLRSVIYIPPGLCTYMKPLRSESLQLFFVGKGAASSSSQGTYDT